MALRAKVLFVFGTRPEAIKLAPVILSMRARPDSFDVHVCVTGQHREMLDEVLSLFEISPNYDLNVMRRDQSLSQLTARLFERLDSVVADTQPDWIIVQGDTTSTMVGGLMGCYHQIPITHVEAGLRTQDRSSPFPEEINRRITDLVADLYFAPTPGAARNLLDEAVDPGRIHVTGNTAIDALFHAILRRPDELPYWYREWIEHVGLERAVCDYVAGMTDRFAESESERLQSERLA